MQSQDRNNPYYLIFEKRRLKVQGIHRARREELFNKSRKMFQLDANDNQQKSVLDTASKQAQEKNINELQGESSLNIQNNQDNFFQIEQAQIKKGLQSISISKEEDQQIKRKQSHQMAIQGQKTKPKQRAKRYKPINKYAKIIQIPSWMNTVPEELTNFYCMARPNGKTGLLVFDSNWMKIYDKFGKYINLQKISQKNINESQIKKLSKNFEGTTLQISYNSQKKKIYIIDVLYWKYSVFTAENFEFRYAWLMANLGPLINSNTGLNFNLIQYLPLSTAQNLKKVYCQDFGYQKQGLLFIQKQSPYIHGYNENVMIWKDSYTSKYPMDQQKKQTTTNYSNNYIYGTGKLLKNRNVYSLDGYKLGYIDYNTMPGQANGYIRFRISGISLNNTTKNTEMQMTEQKLQNNSESSLNLSFVNFEVVQFKKNGKAEPLSRIMFQYRIRHDPLTIEQIASRIIKN